MGGHHYKVGCDVIILISRRTNIKDANLQAELLFVTLPYTSAMG